MDNNTTNVAQGTGDFSAKRLLDMLRITGKKYDLEKIQRAYDYAAELHSGQFRASGEPYISHPLAVAEIVAGLELDTDSICAALLHDTVEDCSDKTDLKEVQKLFGDHRSDLLNKIKALSVFALNISPDLAVTNWIKMLKSEIFKLLLDLLHTKSVS